MAAHHQFKMNIEMFKRKKDEHRGRADQEEQISPLDRFAVVVCLIF
jgi:hypothetical protein